MAKRKRLIVPNMETIDSDTNPNTGSNMGNSPAAGLSRSPLPASAADPAPRSRAPIADVAGQAAATAALETLAGEMAQLKSSGRVIQELPLDAIDLGYLERDRLALDADELDVLKTSIAARGQQTPIEVVDQGDGRYGLISGLRRMHVLHDLQAQGQAQTVLAVIRTPATAADAYTAMVEENEIRVGLSYLERAYVVITACTHKIFPSRDVALRSLFATASRTKRSKIKSFLIVADHMYGLLSFPAKLTERQGLALAAVLEADPEFLKLYYDLVRKSPPATAEQEQAIVARAIARSQAKLNGAARPKMADTRPEVFKDYIPGVTVKISPQKIELTGVSAGQDLAAKIKKLLKDSET